MQCTAKFFIEYRLCQNYNKPCRADYSPQRKGVRKHSTRTKIKHKKIPQIFQV